MNILWYVMVSGGFLASGLLCSKTREIRALKQELRKRQDDAVIDRHFRSVVI